MRTLITLFAVVLLLTVVTPVLAQDSAQEFPADPIEQLRLTPEQRQRIRLIVEQNKHERQSTNRRLREANVALDQALDTYPIHESVIEQRLNELAEAQKAQLRMRIDTEIKIRRELRPEQLAILRDLRLRIRDVVSPQRPANTFTQRPGRNTRRP
ncbi:MAG TPA: periplasmic heavy metal sensor [Pyrinomonadaceae bacterium]|nr:periplasmic heavy metal sensor [Pyrinomonadaceae bacterium]